MPEERLLGSKPVSSSRPATKLPRSQSETNLSMEPVPTRSLEAITTERVGSGQRRTEAQRARIELKKRPPSDTSMPITACPEGQAASNCVPLFDPAPGVMWRLFQPK